MRVYKPTVSKPLPKKHEIIERDGEQLAVIRRSGREVEFPLSSDGKKYLEPSRYYWGKFRNPATRKLEHVPLKVERKEVATKLLDEHIVTATRARRDNPFADNEATPLEKHIADYERQLRRRATAKHCDTFMPRLRKLVQDCGFVFWTDITRERVEAQVEKIAAKGRSVRTCNGYIKSMREFCKWAVDADLFAKSPVSRIKCGNEQADKRHHRRALSAEELTRILAAARDGEPVKGIDGEDRAMLYLVAVETGLRSNELRSLTWASFELGGEHPSVTVDAAYAKAGRDDVLPLRAATAAMLTTWRKERADNSPSDSVFRMPHESTVGRMLRVDIDAARAEWIEEADTDAEREARAKSDFLAYRNHAGRVVDFHALRHTFITNLALAGIPPKVAMDLARHRDINLTMRYYSHTLLMDRASAIDRLPTVATDSIPRNSRKIRCSQIGINHAEDAHNAQVKRATGGAA
ncbi:MAG: tyrosine-type recombinase/integrase [Phycisphaerae bacterium]